MLIFCFCLGRTWAAHPTDEPSAPAAAPQIGVTLTLDQTTYATQAGRAPTMHATLTLFNHSTNPFTFTEHGRRYEWQIKDAQGNVVWDYAQGRMFPHNVRLRTLDPGQTIDYPLDITLASQDGTPLSPGSYTVRGELATDPPFAAEAGFSITKGG